MAALGCALALAVGGALGSPVWDATLRVEGREERSAPNLAQGPVAQVEPEGGLSLLLEDLGGSLRYAPRIVLGGQSATQLFHRGHALLEWRDHARRRLALVEDATYGRADFSPLLPGAPAGLPLDPHLSALRSIGYGSSETSARYEEALSRRLALSAVLSYAVRGGTAAGARLLVPLQRGPQSTLTARWAATSLEELTLALSASRFDASNGSRSTTLTASAQLRSRLSAATSIEVGAGAGDFRAEGDPVQSPGSRILPSASASISSALPLRDPSVAASLAASLAPVVDSLTGDIYQRAQARASLELFADRAFRLTASGTGAHNVGGAFAALGVVQSELAASVGLDPGKVLAAGLRASWQSGQPASMPLFQWVGFVFVTFGGGGIL